MKKLSTLAFALVLLIGGSILTFADLIDGPPGTIARIKTTPLLSFSYVSTGCASSPTALLTFSGGSNYQMAPGYTTPGAGYFPTGNFYIRRVSVTTLAGTSGNWVIVGHSGPNGDWSSILTPVGQATVINYDADAAPLFTVGEYLDAHVASCDGSIAGAISVWYIPASH